MPRETINPPQLFNSTQYGFSQIASGQGNRLVTISGQVGWDADQNIVGSGDLAAQFQQALHNLKIAIEAANGTLDNILLLHIYIVQAAQDDLAPISGGLKSYFPENSPASSWVIVSRLANPDFLVEVEAIAVI